MAAAAAMRVVSGVIYHTTTDLSLIDFPRTVVVNSRLSPTLLCSFSYGSSKGQFLSRAAVWERKCIRSTRPSVRSLTG